MLDPVDVPPHHGRVLAIFKTERPISGGFPIFSLQASPPSALLGQPL